MRKYIVIIATLVLLLTAIAPAGAAAQQPVPDPSTGDRELAELGTTQGDPERLAATAHDLNPPSAAVQAEHASRFGADDSKTPRRPNHVFLPDDRQRMSPAFPVFAQILVGNDGEDQGYICSATFVGPTVLLTAAHCLHIMELGGWPDYAAVIPGMDGETAPYDVYYAADTYVPEGWIETGDPAYDIGLLIMEDATAGEQAGPLPLGLLTDEVLSAPDLNPVTVGYPGDKPFGTQWATSVPAFDRVEEDYLVSTLDQVQGQSGSAIMRPGDNAILGITSFEGSLDGVDYNVARRVDRDVLDFALSACQDAGCSFNYLDETGEGLPTPNQPGPADPGGGSPFERTWARTDQPVASGAASRTWMWGPEPFTEPMTEPYAEAPDGQRQVVYYDKARMEITDPSADSNSVWYVTNGLLVVELITGRMQLGHNTYEQYQPAPINVAGDAGDPEGPTYQTFQSVLDAAPSPAGEMITRRIDRQGNVTDDPSLAGRAVTGSYLDEVTNHMIAAPFWTFMNASGTVWQSSAYIEASLFENPYFATGRPITEAYWASVQVGGTDRDVLVQCFERRCLTYTPDNLPGWQVEAGNVGRHYHTWRYEQVGQ